MSSARLPRARGPWWVGVLVVSLGLLGPTAIATAAGGDQGLLCDGSPNGCSLSADRSVVAGHSLAVAVGGNPGAKVAVRFYRIEFNSAGAITGLTPQGSARQVTTSASGKGTTQFAPGAGDGDSSTPGGWGFVGLADDDSLDLDARLGAIVAFGNNAVHLLGDGYAYQKPIDDELDMHVVGTKMAGYWVEYKNDSGDWVALPGHGPNDQTYLRGSPGEVSHIHYRVPADLTVGKPYTFRITTSLNYSGGKLVKDAGFAEWIVIPSGDPKKQGRGKNFNPNLPAGKADKPDPVPSYTPAPSQSPTPTPTPTGNGSASPSGGPSPQPTATRGPGTRPTPTPRPRPSVATSQPTASANPTPSASPTAGAGAGGAASPMPSPSASTTADSTVWGREATPEATVLTDSRPAGFPLATAAAVLLLLVVAAPLAWWAWSRHRLATRPLEDMG